MTIIFLGDLDFVFVSTQRTSDGFNSDLYLCLSFIWLSFISIAVFHIYSCLSFLELSFVSRALFPYISEHNYQNYERDKIKPIAIKMSKLINTTVESIVQVQCFLEYINRCNCFQGDARLKL